MRRARPLACITFTFGCLVALTDTRVAADLARSDARLVKKVVALSAALSGSQSDARTSINSEPPLENDDVGQRPEASEIWCWRVQRPSRRGGGCARRGGVRLLGMVVVDA